MNTSKRTNTNSKINEKIESLNLRLAQIAMKFAQYEKGSDWMDYYQTMCEALIKQASIDPSFADQKDAYILKFAEHIAHHVARDAAVYMRYVDEEGGQIDPESEEDCEDSRLDLVETRSKLLQAMENIESEVMTDELVAMIGEGAKLLNKENKLVVYMIYLGYKQVEIAETLNISKPAVSQRLRTIASTLQPFVKGF